MHIGIDARFFGTTGKGLGRYTEKLISSLEQIDTENTYTIFLYKESYHEYIPKNPNFTKVGVPYKWYGFAEQFLYPFLLFRYRVDLMHFPHFNVPFLYQLPFVVTIHDLILLRYPTKKASTHQALWYGLKYFFYQKIIRSALQRAKTIIAVSDFTKADILLFDPKAEKKLVVTKEGVDQSCFWMPAEKKQERLAEYWKQTGRNTNTPFALYVGNAYPHKNLEAFLHLAKEVPERDIVLVGKEDYFYQRFRSKVALAGLSNIYFVGGVSDQDLALLYGAADVYVFPSLYEGFGLPPLEAMQYGTRVLVSNRGSLPEIVGEAAAVADPEKQDFLRTYLVLCQEGSVVRQKTKKAGYVWAAQFEWQKMARETKDVYTKEKSKYQEG
jgi:glycosyltransferase involved in cell wall biosynthesis